MPGVQQNPVLNSIISVIRRHDPNTQNNTEPRMSIAEFRRTLLNMADAAATAGNQRLALLYRQTAGATESIDRAGTPAFTSDGFVSVTDIQTTASYHTNSAEGSSTDLDSNDIIKSLNMLINLAPQQNNQNP